MSCGPGEVVVVPSGTRCVLVRTRAAPWGVALELIAPSTGERAGLRLRVQPPVGARLYDSRVLSMGWQLARRVPRRPRGGDFFHGLRGWAWLQLCGDARDVPPSVHARLWAALDGPAAHAWATAQPHARRLAARAGHGVRFAVYRLLAEDASGRLAQLALACPGAIALAVWLRFREAQEPLERLLSGVARGRRLDPLLDEVLARAVGAEVLHVRGLRRLVRRAGPGVDPDDLLALAGADLPPEDIPKTPRENRIYYDVVAQAARRLSRHRAVPPARARAIVRWASAHALALARLTRPRARPAVDAVVDYLSAEGRAPPRAAAPLPIVEAAARWQRRILAAWGWTAYDAVALQPGLSLAAPLLPPAPGDGFTDGAVAVRALQAPIELLREGRCMRHCVADRLPQALAGDACYYAVELRDTSERLTVEIVRRGATLALGDARGRDNRLPTPEELARLQPWLRSLEGEVAA